MEICRIFNRTPRRQTRGPCRKHDAPSSPLSCWRLSGAQSFKYTHLALPHDFFKKNHLDRRLVQHEAVVLPKLAEGQRTVVACLSCIKYVFTFSILWEKTAFYKKYVWLPQLVPELEEGQDRPHDERLAPIYSVHKDQNLP